MKLVFISIVLCAAICVGSAMKLLASSSNQLTRQETNLFKRLIKRQAYNDPNCDRRSCPTPNCGKDFVAAALQGECCERCVPWEYAQSMGLPYKQGPQPVQDPRAQPRSYDPYGQPQQQQQQNRADVYIYGPDDGARVSSGHSIYFDCEVSSPYNQYAQPRWTRAGGQPLPPKAQSTPLAGNRKIARLTIPDTTHGEAGRYECSAGTGNPSDQASIDLQVTDGGYYPRAQPQPQPQPQYPGYDPYNQPRPQLHPQPHHPQPHHPQPHHPQPHHPQPQPGGDDEGGDEGEDQAPATKAPQPGPTPAPAAPDAGEGAADEGEYPEDYSENEK
jgi:hypothetical protein